MHLGLTLILILFSYGTCRRGRQKSPKKVAFDVSFAFTFKVGRSLRPLTDLERRVVAKTIVEYLQLSNWVPRDLLRPYPADLMMLRR
jgi:hypothetical protein